jgi:hypothetical protein
VHSLSAMYCWFFCSSSCHSRPRLREGCKALFERSGGCLFWAPGLTCSFVLKEPADKRVIMRMIFQCSDAQWSRTTATVVLESAAGVFVFNFCIRRLCAFTLDPQCSILSIGTLVCLVVACTPCQGHHHGVSLHGLRVN